MIPTLGDTVWVTAAQMQAIEGHLWAAGLPVAALMEKVVLRVSQWIAAQYPAPRRVAVLVGPGHNGADALGVARELHHRGYGVRLAYLRDRLKPLTQAHSTYAQYLGIPSAPLPELLQGWEPGDLLIDGGFGLSRPLSGTLATHLDHLHHCCQGQGVAVVALDLPSGLDTDRGQPLGTALAATHTLCLGLWKRGLLVEAAIPWVGQCHRIPLDIPDPAITAVLGNPPQQQRLTAAIAQAHLPLHRAATAHKYRVGHLLLVAGSRSYRGAALLALQGAIASGVGMVTLVVPEGLADLALALGPEALVVTAPTSPDGAIAALPQPWPWERYDALAIGPGLGPDCPLLPTLWSQPHPLVLDADGLTWLARQGTPPRPHPTLLTPHWGEFRRLFPHLNPQDDPNLDALTVAHQGAIASGHTIILKGARTGITHPDGGQWVLPQGTPALARGGSGDVLTGLLGGLAAQAVTANAPDPLLSAALGGVWWHGETGRALAQQRTVLGVNPTTLAQYLLPFLAQSLLQMESGQKNVNG